MGNTVTKSLNGVNLPAKDINSLNNTLNEKNLTSGGFLPLSWGYIHVYNHYFQTSSLKLFGRSGPNFIWSFLRKWERKSI